MADRRARRPSGNRGLEVRGLIRLPPAVLARAVRPHWTRSALMSANHTLFALFAEVERDRGGAGAHAAPPSEQRPCGEGLHLGALPCGRPRPSSGSDGLSFYLVGPMTRPARSASLHA